MSIFSNADGFGAVKDVFQLSDGVLDNTFKKPSLAIQLYQRDIKFGKDPVLALADNLSDFDSSVQDFAKSKDVAKMGAKELVDSFAESTIQTQAQNHSLSSTRKILNEYNKGIKQGAKDQTNLTKAVKKGNVALGDYLENLGDGKEASMFGFLAKSAGDTMLDITGDVLTSLANGIITAAISAGISLIATGLDRIIVTAEEAREGMNDAFAEYDAAKEKVASVKSEIEETQAKIDALNAKGGPCRSRDHLE